MSGHVFHPGHHELHGITVVVETSSGATYVGRFDREDGEWAHLKDVGIHRAGQDGELPDFLQRALKFGIKVDERQATVPVAEIARIVKLSELAGSA